MPRTKLDVGSDVVYLAKKPEALEYYIQWAALPRGLRPDDLKSQAKVAVYLGVTEDTIRNWKRDPRVAARVQQVGLGAFRVERYAELLEVAYQQAVDPENPRSIQATKILLEEMKRFTDSHETPALSEMSDAELKEMVVDLYDQLAEREDRKSS
jgi:superfamily II DNA or RNA helicase